MKSLFYHFRGGLTPNECECIRTVAFDQGLSPGLVYNGKDSNVDLSHRRSNIAWLDCNDPNLRWLFDRLTIYALEANMHSFKLALDNEPRLSMSKGQFTEYLAEENGAFNWHRDSDYIRDNGKSSVRKLTVCVQLTNPSEFEGGTFELEDAALGDAYTRLGDVIVFPSMLKHRVSPVTKGTRHVFVLWFFGPQLR